ncbi:rhodanese-like domain-containing protein [Rhodopseudomonas sp.]|uniref:rhodanese-like domain-containing protein n=1 Tax=Rhodopseudomonas sp. TaxID=1078 RepID=UPI003B3ADE1B
MKTISAVEAQQMVSDGAVLVDIREPAEVEREHIDGALTLPLSGFAHADLRGAKGRKAIFFCASGGRTRIYAGQIEAKAKGVCDAYVLSGGIAAWRRAGFPTKQAPRPPGLLQRLFGRG